MSESVTVTVKSRKGTKWSKPEKHLAGDLFFEEGLGYAAIAADPRMQGLRPGVDARQVREAINACGWGYTLRKKLRAAAAAKGTSVKRPRIGKKSKKGKGRKKGKKKSTARKAQSKKSEVAMMGDRSADVIRLGTPEQQADAKRLESAYIAAKKEKRISSQKALAAAVGGNFTNSIISGLMRSTILPKEGWMEKIFAALGEEYEPVVSAPAQEQLVLPGAVSSHDEIPDSGDGGWLELTSRKSRSTLRRRLTLRERAVVKDLIRKWEARDDHRK